MSSYPDGILLVDKPQGITSFAVVARVRYLLQQGMVFEKRGSKGPGGRPPRFRCGHAGTLDPLATGLLIVLVGRGSRLAPFLLGLDKSYTATVRFGTETDTLDAEGEVVATRDLPASALVIEAALSQFRGDINQVPPVYSALKRNGQTLHRLARAGQEIPELEPRAVTISQLEMTTVKLTPQECVVGLEIACGSGTYIRSLARDLGRAVVSVAHLEALRRTRIGPFSIADASVDAMSQDAAVLRAALLPLAEALPHLPYLDLTIDETQSVLNGGQPELGWLERLLVPAERNSGKGDYFTMRDPDGNLVAVGEIPADTGTPRLAAVVGKG